MVAGVFILILLALYLPRGKIMAAWPNSVRLYRMAGLAPKPVGEGLDLRDARAVIKQTPAGRMLSIEGEIVNSGTRTRQVPDLQAVQMDNNETLQSWIFSSGITALASGKSQHFAVTESPPANTAGEIMITFATQAQHEAENGHK